MKKTALFLSCLLLSLSLLFVSCSKEPTEGDETDSTVYYTVTYNSNGGTAVPSEQVPAGSRATEPSAPTLENRVFKGWTHNGILWSFSRTVTEDMTLTAKWENAGERFTYQIIDGSATVTGLKNTSDLSELVIPPTIAGFPVTAIGESAFTNLPSDSLSSLTLPATITTVGSYAFDGCTDLTISLSGAKLTKIGEHAFADCNGLLGVSLGEGLTEIPASAFMNCTGLANLTLPTTLTLIDESAFEGCENLSSLLIHPAVEEIGHSAFRDCSRLSSLLFGGTAEQFEALLEGVVPTMNDAFLALEDKVCLYSESEPVEDGSFWHYDEANLPKVW